MQSLRALVGYALDGYGIYAMTDLDGVEATDLDDCRGHTDDVRGYHYHAASVSENMFIGCYSGEVAVTQNRDAGGRPDDGGAGGPPGGDDAAAAPDGDADNGDTAIETDAISI